MKTILINGEIGWDIMPSDIRSKLKNAKGDDIEFEISSAGGFVYEGIEIFNLIRDYSRQFPGAALGAVIKGLAASMASYIAVNPAFSYVKAEDNAIFMIHNPMGLTAGDYHEMSKMAEVLEGITGILAEAYIKKTGKSQKAIRSLMDEEGWFFGSEIMDAGFVDEILAECSPDEEEKKKSVIEARLKVTALMDKIKNSEKTKDDIMQVAAYLKDDRISNDESFFNKISTIIKDSLALTGKNKKEVNNMELEDTNVPSFSAEDVTLEWLKENKSDIINGIIENAKSEERERMKAIDDVQNDTEDKSEDIVNFFVSAKYEKGLTAAEVALEINKMNAEKRKQFAQDRHEDASGIPPVNQNGDGKTGEGMTAEQRKEAYKAGIKEWRGK